MEQTQEQYFDRYLDQRFTNIEGSMSRIESTITELKVEVREENKSTREDNKITRRWIVATGTIVLFGFAGIFFAFAKLQTSWMQTVISFATQALLK